MIRRRPDRPARTLAWGRPQLLAVLAAAAVAVLALTAGLGYLLVTTLTDTHARDSDRAPGHVTGAANGTADETVRRDRLAAAPMPTLPPEAARPQPMTTAVPPVLTVPAATGVDDVGVATGFPATPAGAVGQLAAIDRAAFTGAGLPQTRAVIGAWAAPGGPTAESWSGVRAMAALLTSAGLGGDAAGADIQFVPSMGQVKATDGPSWVVACVNGTLTMTVQRTARVAVSDCQRMVWTGGRWMVGPGPEPAASPSAWPGSQAAIGAGWRELRDA